MPAAPAGRTGWVLKATLLLWVTLAWRVAGAATPVALPNWADQVTGTYIGRDHNDGELQCERVVFSLSDGALVGHYWVGADDPFEGDLIDFVGEPGAGPNDTRRAGRFTWVDRYGRGVRVIRWAADSTSFFSLWGQNRPNPALTGFGLRGADAVVAGCNGAPVS